MWKFLVRRILLSIVILFFVSLIVYLIMRALPTSYVEGIARERASLPGGKSYTEWLQQLNQLQLDGGGVSKVFLDGLRILS